MFGRKQHHFIVLIASCVVLFYCLSEKTVLLTVYFERQKFCCFDLLSGNNGTTPCILWKERKNCFVAFSACLQTTVLLPCILFSRKKRFFCCFCYLSGNNGILLTVYFFKKENSTFLLK